MTGIACGTLAGYSLHRRRGESTCQLCRDAKAEYQRQQRSQSTRRCRVPACQRPVLARDMCGLHWGRDRTHGSALWTRPTVSDRFWARVTGGDVTTCWMWQGARTTNGYGKFAVRSDPYGLAHRWAWRLLIGEIPAGLTLDHLCRVQLCVNPWHLDPVPRSVNTRRQHETRKA